MRELDKRRYAVKGTPTDCVIIGVRFLPGCGAEPRDLWVLIEFRISPTMLPTRAMSPGTVTGDSARVGRSSARF